jgi:hypothetical protein
MKTPQAIAAAMRAYACGIYPAEAATELLIHTAWLRRGDFHTHIAISREAVTDTELAYLDWRAATTALDAGDLPCSGSDARLLRLAASLADGISVDLREALSNLDDHSISLVIQAGLHATGDRPITMDPWS